jgi:outer membrane cobalamin receptor
LHKKIIFILLYLLFIFHLCQAQSTDSIYSSYEDSVFVEESLTDKICSLFTTNYLISSEDINNSIYRSLGDILKTNKAINVTGYGPYGQPEYASLWGSTSRQFLIYQDDISFFQQAIYIPQSGDFDLFTVPLENIESIQIIDNPVVNILGKDIGLGGLRLKPKEYKTEVPFSRINYERGPYGHRRTQVELGRDFGKKTSFYLTYGRKKSDGYIDNSDFKSLYLTGVLGYRLKENWSAEFKAYHYENRAGNPLPYDLTTALRIRNDRWILDLNSDYRFKNNSLLRIETFYSLNSAKSHMGGYFLDRKKEEEEYYLKGINESVEKSIDEGYLSYLHLLELSSKLNTFLFFRLNRNQEFGWNLSGAGGASYQANKELNFFSTFTRSFSNPTLHDLYLRRNYLSIHADSFYFSYIEIYNTLLHTEELNSGSFGFSWIKNDFELRNSFFFSWNPDNIEWTFFRSTGLSPAYSSLSYLLYPSNRDRKLLGLSMIFDYKFSPDFQSGFSYAYKWARAEDDCKVPYVPAHSFFSYFQYSKEYIRKRYEIKLRLEQEYLSSRFLADYNQDLVPFVLLFNSKITLRFLDFRFYYVIENITNEVYKTRGDYDMPGRTLWFGFSWGFHD